MNTQTCLLIPQPLGLLLNIPTYTLTPIWTHKHSYLYPNPYINTQTCILITHLPVCILITHLPVCIPAYLLPTNLSIYLSSPITMMYYRTNQLRINQVLAFSGEIKNDEVIITQWRIQRRISRSPFTRSRGKVDYDSFPVNLVPRAKFHVRRCKTVATYRKQTNKHTNLAFYM